MSQGALIPPRRRWSRIVAVIATVGLCAASGCSSNVWSGSGSGSETGQPVLVAKIDNSPQARPPIGVAAADSVYVEPVEGGLSRLAAIFSHNKPPVIGPIRSARETDLELLAQFGHPTLAFSGAAPELIPSINRAPLQNASADLQPAAYYRDSDREAPHNLFARPDKLPTGSDWPAASQPQFGPTPPDGQPSEHQEVQYPDAVIGFDWSPTDHRWMVSMDGTPYAAADTGPLGAGTVVLQDVQVRNSAFHDVAGSVSPLVETVGSGHAVVLRDGAAFPAEWSRPSPESGTTYTAPTGEPIPFAPGQVWTVLTPDQS